MPQNAFFLRTRDLLVSQKTTQRHYFSTLHPISPVIFATATVVALVLLRDSRFNFHCYTQREATLTQKSARKWRCDLSRLLARKITKGIHSCKPASLNRPIVVHMNMGESKYLHFSKVYISWLHFVTAKSYGQQRKMKQRQKAEVAPKTNSKRADLHETALLTPHSG